MPAERTREPLTEAEIARAIRRVLPHVSAAADRRVLELYPSGADCVREGYALGASRASSERIDAAEVRREVRDALFQCARMFGPSSESGLACVGFRDREYPPLPEARRSVTLPTSGDEVTLERNPGGGLRLVRKAVGESRWPLEDFVALIRPHDTGADFDALKAFAASTPTETEDR